MDGYISFSELNDFLFCPQSLYLHTLYKNYKSNVYHDTPQTDGKAAHETIDQATYNKGGWETGVWLSSPSYRIYGRCDLYNPTTGELVERKRTIRRIYEGQRMQAWAQAMCLMDMGKSVTSVTLHSLTDNLRYSIPVPDEKIKLQVKQLVHQMLTYKANYTHETKTIDTRCRHCIYAPLCPIANLGQKN